MRWTRKLIKHLGERNKVGIKKSFHNFLVGSRLAHGVAETKLRIDRGSGWANWVKNILLMSASIKLLLPISDFWAIMLVPIGLLTFWVMGHLDLRYLKWYQTESKIQTKKYNPYFNRQMRGIRKVIREELKKNG
jgi:hypothetical protein